MTLRQHTLSARYTPSDAIREPLLLNLAVLGVGLHTRVTRGENAGRDLPQDFVVLGYRRYRSQNGLWTVELPESPAIPEGRQALAVWISRPGNPAPLQAVGGWLP